VKEFLVLIDAHHRDLVRLGDGDWNIGIMERLERWTFSGVTGAHGRKRRIERLKGQRDQSGSITRRRTIKGSAVPGASPAESVKNAPKCSNANIDGPFMRFSQVFH